MKEVMLKYIGSWILGIINFGIYTSDSMDDLVLKLKKLDLEVQANELTYLYKQMLIEEQFKSVMMFISILFLFVANLQQIKNLALFIYVNVFQRFYLFIKTKFKKN